MISPPTLTENALPHSLNNYMDFSTHLVKWAYSSSYAVFSAAPKTDLFFEKAEEVSRVQKTI